MASSKGNGPLTLPALKVHLWNCAEILRGSAVDRTDWKAYILPLLFFKRICDVWDEETADATKLYGDVDPVDFPEIHRFDEQGGRPVGRTSFDLERGELDPRVRERSGIADRALTELLVERRRRTSLPARGPPPLRRRTPAPST